MPKYLLPLPLKSITHWHKKSSPAHRGRCKHALDFFAPQSTKIFSIADGEVVWIKKDSKVGGYSKKYIFDGNRIVIRHPNGVYSAYEHMKFGGVLVKVGQTVKRGQLIGMVGNTGWSSGPHLHFELFRKPDPDESEGHTIPISFGIGRKGRCDEYCYG